MLIPGLYQAIRQIDEELGSLGISQATRDGTQGEEVPTDLMKQAQLEASVSGAEFGGARGLSESYAEARRKLARTLLCVRADLVALAQEVRRADEDLRRVGEENTRAFERLVDRIVGEIQGAEPRRDEKWSSASHVRSPTADEEASDR